MPDKTIPSKRIKNWWKHEVEAVFECSNCDRRVKTSMKAPPKACMACTDRKDGAPYSRSPNKSLKVFAKEVMNKGTGDRKKIAEKWWLNKKL